MSGVHGTIRNYVEVYLLQKHGIQSKVKFVRVQRVNSVARQYNQSKETGGGGECSLAGLCGLQMLSKCVASSIKGKIHRVQQGIPLQRNTTSLKRQEEGGNAPWRGCVWVTNFGVMLAGCKG